MMEFKSLKVIKLSPRHAFIIFSIFTLTCSAGAHGSTCEIDGPDGSWKHVATNKWDFYDHKPWSNDRSCWVSGSGTYVSGDPDNYLTYQIIQGDKKLVESADRSELYSSVDTPRASCWQKGDEASCCEGQCGSILENSPGTIEYPIWPPCITELETALSPQEKSGCTKQVICGEGTKINFRRKSGCYGYWTSSSCIGWTVKKRQAYQWVCNDCSQQYSDLVNDCGAVANIIIWDNETCKGSCKPDVEKNLEPPCEPDQCCNE